MGGRKLHSHFACMRVRLVLAWLGFGFGLVMVFCINIIIIIIIIIAFFMILPFFLEGGFRATVGNQQLGTDEKE